MEYLWSLWASLRPWIAWAWTWIKANHEPLTVVVTFLGVLVAWRYVVLTRRLAETANVQAGAARDQAQASRLGADAAADQAQASRAGAEAAADQARIARQIFEAAHRPYLSVAVKQLFYGDMSNFRILFAVKNHGPVPATLKEWRAEIRVANVGSVQRGPQAADAGICIFPDATEEMEFQAPGGWGGVVRPLPEGFEIDFSVEYGFREAVYRTSLSARSEGGYLEIVAQRVE
jgi:xanthosine utilization system XapX-like protein